MGPWFLKVSIILFDKPSTKVLVPRKEPLLAVMDPVGTAQIVGQSEATL